MRVQHIMAIQLLVLCINGCGLTASHQDSAEGPLASVELLDPRANDRGTFYGVNIQTSGSHIYIEEVLVSVFDDIDGTGDRGKEEVTISEVGASGNLYCPSSMMLNGLRIPNDVERPFLDVFVKTSQGVVRFCRAVRTDS